MKMARRATELNAWRINISISIWWTRMLNFSTASITLAELAVGRVMRPKFEPNFQFLGKKRHRNYQMVAWQWPVKLTVQSVTPISELAKIMMELCAIHSASNGCNRVSRPSTTLTWKRHKRCPFAERTRLYARPSHPWYRLSCLDHTSSAPWWDSKFRGRKSMISRLGTSTCRSQLIRW